VAGDQVTHLLGEVGLGAAVGDVDVVTTHVG
jgi:hypothetical protein